MEKINTFQPDSLFPRLYTHPKCPPIAYSDGSAVEAKLLDIVKRVSDVSCGSPELKSEIKDWPSEYHFSIARQNLLRPFDLGKNKKVLELGCGCGAITRYIGEIGFDVTAIEGGKTRSEISAERCRDLKNVKVLCANYNDLDLTEESFDYIFLIGVLEYAGLFWQDGAAPAKEAAQEILNQLKLALKPAGRLVIAIENRLGLKYFAGCTEDHLGIEYEGLVDYPNNKQVATFSKKELTALLNMAGLMHCSFYYPFPDYKIPQSMLSESFINEDGAERFWGDIRDYSHLRKFRFRESLVAKSLQKDGILDRFANSFIVFAARNGESLLSAPEFDFVSYSDSRLKQSLIVETKKNYKAYSASQRQVFPELTEGNNMRCALGDITFYTGRLFSDELYRSVLVSGSLDGFGELLNSYFAFLSVFLEQNDVRESINVVFDNMVIQRDGNLCLLECKWKSDKIGGLGDDTSAFLVFHALFHWVEKYLFYGKATGVNNNLETVKDILNIGFDTLRILRSEAMFANFFDVEADFLCAISHSSDISECLGRITRVLSSGWGIATNE